MPGGHSQILQFRHVGGADVRFCIKTIGEVALDLVASSYACTYTVDLHACVVIMQSSITEILLSFPFIVLVRTCCVLFVLDNYNVLYTMVRDRVFYFLIYTSILTEVIA